MLWFSSVNKSLTLVFQMLRAMKEKIGTIIQRIDKLGSSNNYAASQILTKRLPEGIVFVANSQVDGRGQASNKWESEPNMNLTFSILLYPDFLEITKQFEISKAISLGVADFLKPLASQVSIKWPNDIYISNGKVAGILIENSVRVDVISSCIVGIGLNINQQVFTSDAPNPISLSQHTGKTYDLEQSLTNLCRDLDRRYQQLESREFSRIDKDYTDMLYLNGCWSLFADQDGDFEGRITGVDKHGRLKIETRSGVIKKYDFKEVIFKGK